MARSDYPAEADNYPVRLLIIVCWKTIHLLSHHGPRDRLISNPDAKGPEGDAHETPPESLPSRTRDPEGRDGPGGSPGEKRAGDVALPAGEDPRLADQRLCLLHPHAYPRRARPRRERRAALP